MPISPRASEIGLPALRASSRARSSTAAPRARPRAGAAARRDRRARPRRQAGNASLARARPRRRSPRRPPAGISAITSSVAGSMTWIIDVGAPRMRARAPPRPARRSRGCARPPPGATARRAAKRRAGQLDRLDDVVVGRSRSRPAPSPSSSTPWWWCDLTAVCSPPTARAASEPGSRRDLVVAEGAGRVPVVVVPDASGRCWLSVPPQAHVQHLHAAADPQHRHVALERARARARARSGRARAGCRASPGAAARRSCAGSMSDPPASIRPSSRSSSSSGDSATTSSGGSSSAMPPAPLHGQRVGARRERCRPPPRRPSATLSIAAQMPMTGRAHSGCPTVARTRGTSPSR